MITTGEGFPTKGALEEDQAGKALVSSAPEEVVLISPHPRPAAWM